MRNKKEDKMAQEEKSYDEMSSFEKSMDDIKHGRVTTWASAEEMFKALGI